MTETPFDDSQPQGESSEATDITEATVSTDYKVRGKKAATGGTGVLGHNTATSGQSHGVEGVTDADGDVSNNVYPAGVSARATGSNTTFGVYGRCESKDATVVVGDATEGGTAGPRKTGLVTGVAGVTDRSGADSGVDQAYGVIGSAAATSGLTVGVFGETLSPDGTGVTARNAAPTGTPVAVKGVVPNSTEGYGLYTPDDARVERQLSAATVEETFTLPDYTTVGDNPAAVIGAMQRVFAEPSWVADLPAGWTDGTYKATATHGETGNPSFSGAAVLPNGIVVFAPFESDNIGLYNPGTGTYTSGPSHGEGTRAFRGAALSSTGEVVFVPRDSPNVGVYDPVARSYTSGDSHGQGAEAFIGGALAPTDNIVFAPLASDVVGEYDVTNDVVTTPAAHNEGDFAFAGAVLTHEGTIVFVPYSSSNIGVYDPESGSYSSGPSHGEGSAAFLGGALTPDGRVVFAPVGSNNVGVYDPATDSYTSGPSHGQGDLAFAGATLTATGEVVFGPNGSRSIGVYDPVNDKFITGPSQDVNNGIGGAILAPNGQIVFEPGGSDTVGTFERFAGTTVHRGNAAHPLVNSL